MRKIISNHWSIILLTLVIIFGLFLCTFYIYPILIHNYVQTLSGYSYEDDKLGKGTYGDMYGALNTFFSGLAFIGLIVTIGIQIYLHEEEKRLEKEKEKSEERKKLLYFENLVQKSILFTIDSINNLQNFYTEILNNPKEIPKIKQGPNNEMDIIVNKINQESLFNAYTNQLKTDGINEILASFTVILFSYNDFIRSLEASNKFDVERKKKCANHLNNWISELREVLHQLKGQDKQDTKDFIFLEEKLKVISLGTHEDSSNMFQFDSILNEMLDFLCKDDKFTTSNYKNLAELTRKAIYSFPPILSSNKEVANQSQLLQNKLKATLKIVEQNISTLSNFKKIYSQK